MQATVDYEDVPAKRRKRVTINTPNGPVSVSEGDDDSNQPRGK